MIDQNFKDTVSGYLHEMEEELELSSNIPMLISYNCLLFCKDQDFFTQCDDDRIKMSNNSKTISCNKEGRANVIGNDRSSRGIAATSACIIGNQRIDYNQEIIAKWKIKIDKSSRNVTDPIGCIIGIMDENNEKLLRLYGNGWSISDKWEIDDSIYNKKKDRKMRQFKTGVIVTYILDLNKKM